MGVPETVPLGGQRPSACQCRGDPAQCLTRTPPDMLARRCVYTLPARPSPRALRRLSAHCPTSLAGVTLPRRLCGTRITSAATATTTPTSTRGGACTQPTTQRPCQAGRAPRQGRQGAAPCSAPAYSGGVLRMRCSRSLSLTRSPALSSSSPPPLPETERRGFSASDTRQRRKTQRALPSTRIICSGRCEFGLGRPRLPAVAEGAL